MFNQAKDKMMTAWSNLADKDRKTLVLAAPVVVFLLLYLLVFQPLMGRYSEARQYKEELSDTLIWLYENAALVDRLQNVCIRQRQIDQDGENLIQFAKNIGRKAGINAEFRQSSDGTLTTTLRGAPGNRALASIQSFACNGYIVSDFKLTRKNETSTDVDLSFTLSASSLLEKR